MWDGTVPDPKPNGLEGIVAKRATSRYETGERSGAWIKYKTNQGQGLVIGGYKPGAVGFDYLLAGYYQGKNLIFIGKIKNGFSPPYRATVRPPILIRICLPDYLNLRCSRPSN